MTPNPRINLPPTYDQIAELAAMARQFNAANRSTSSSIGAEPKIVKRRIRQRVSPEAVAQLVERYRSGEHTPVLSREYGISRSSLCALLRSEGVKMRRRPIDSATKQHALDLHARGSSIREVAKTVGVSYGAIRNVLRDSGVKHR